MDALSYVEYGGPVAAMHRILQTTLHALCESNVSILISSLEKFPRTPTYVGGTILTLTKF
jgi:hypothetical protein